MRPRVVLNCNRKLAEAASEVGFRLNGSRITDFRKCQVTFGKSYGSCEVVYEPGTRVHAQVSASVGEPNDSRPGEGILTVSTWISPIVTGHMGGAGTKPTIISRTIEKMFKDNRAVDLEALCIKFSEKVWVLRVDVHIIDGNGCLAEAAVLAVLGALLTFRMRQSRVDAGSGELTVPRLKAEIPVRLRLNHIPILTSFAVTDGNRILPEPDQGEEKMYPGKVMLGVNNGRELTYLHVTSPINYEILSEATRMAFIKCHERIKWLKELVVKNDDLRFIPIYMKGNEPRKNGRVIDLSQATASSLLHRSKSQSTLRVTPAVDEIGIFQGRPKSKKKKKRVKVRN